VAEETPVIPVTPATLVTPQAIPVIPVMRAEQATPVVLEPLVA
jgi:hypothetical protein